MAEKFIKTLKKICNYMTTVSENVSFVVLDDIAKNYNNMYHKTIKIKPTGFKSNSCAEYSIDSNEKDTNLKSVIM